MSTTVKMKTALAVIAIGLVLTGGSRVVGSIPNAGALEALSENGAYKVNVAARVAQGKIKSRMLLFTMTDHEWRQLWTVEFADNTHPAAVYVSNHGCVVTAGNTLPGSGVEQHALVIYQDGEVLRQYSRGDLLSRYGEPEKTRHAAGTRVASVVPLWYGRSPYATFDAEERFCIWDDATRAWVLVDLTDGSLVTAEGKHERHYVEQARKDAYAQINEKNGEGCYAYYYRLARFLHPEDKPVFEELLTTPYSQEIGTGYSSGPGDIYFFAGNRYRELAEWALAAFEEGKQDAVGDSRSFDRHEGYRQLGSLTVSATFQEAPTSSDGIVVLWLEPADGRADAPSGDRPEHAMGIDLQYKIGKPLVMPVKIHFYGVTPGKYRVRGYWNRDIKQVYAIKDDFWKRTGQFTVADPPEVEIPKGGLVDVALSFERDRTP